MALTRSEQMRRIEGVNTRPELTLRRALWGRGFRYRINYRIGRTSADLVFVRAKVAVFVDGCFWHGCPEHYTKPRSNPEFWRRKLADNVERDSRNTRLAEGKGWKVLRIWEHEIWDDLDGVVARIAQALRGSEWHPSPDWRVFRVEGIVAGEDALERRYLRPLRDDTLVDTVVCRRVSGAGRPGPRSRR